MTETTSRAVAAVTAPPDSAVRTGATTAGPAGHGRGKVVLVTYRRNAIPADAVARAVSYALAQPADVDVNEIVLRPAAQR